MLLSCLVDLEVEVECPEQGPESLLECGKSYDRAMTKLVPAAIWKRITNLNSAIHWKPPATILGGGDLAAILPQTPILSVYGNVDLAAAGDLKCQNCPSGGSWGVTGMYEVGRQILCANCAVKRLGIEDLPEVEKIETLTPYLLPSNR